MTCSACGNVLAPGARFCPVCGAVVAFSQYPGPAYAGAFLPPYNRVATHLQTLGTLWLVYAAVRMVTGLLGMIFLHSIFGRHHLDSWGAGWGSFGHLGFATLWPFAFTSLMVSVAIATLTGYALLTRQPWGRIVAIIFGILALFHPLLGTALGIFTLWVLAPRASGLEYEARAYTARRA